MSVRRRGGEGRGERRKARDVEEEGGSIQRRAQRIRSLDEFLHRKAVFGCRAFNLRELHGQPSESLYCSLRDGGGSAWGVREGKKVGDGCEEGKREKRKSATQMQEGDAKSRTFEAFRRRLLSEVLEARRVLVRLHCDIALRRFFPRPLLLLLVRSTGKQRLWASKLQVRCLRPSNRQLDQILQLDKNLVLLCRRSGFFPPVPCEIKLGATSE
jgi:hypothetical protein